MTNQYTPEKVAELVETARTLARHSSISQKEHATAISDLADALTAVSAELATVEKFLASYKAATKRAEAERDRLHKAITDELVNRLLFKYDNDQNFNVREFRAALEAALDKEGNDDE